MRQDPIISTGWLRAALIILVAGALGAGTYVLASGAHLDLPDVPGSSGGGTTTLSKTTLEDTTIGQEAKPAPAAKSAPLSPTIQRLQELNRCTQAAHGDFQKVTACFDRFNSGQAP